MRMGRYSNRARNSRMLTVMTTSDFESLLSTRARYAVPLTTPRASMNPLYEFGGGYPDPVSFPYEGMIEATAKMMAAEGAAAMTYGEPQGYLGLRELIYTLVDVREPAGPSHVLRRRQELLALAHEFDTRILGDDAYGELRFEGEALPPLYALDRGGRVIRAGTLSKILGAGVRLGWLCAPRAMLPAFQGFNFGGGVNPFMSRIATWYLRDHMEEHVKLLIDVYRAKRDAMLRGLWEVLESTDVEISRPAGGFFIWIRLPPGTDSARLEELAVAARAQYTPGPAFFPNGGGERFIRLAFSYEPPAKCYEGARLIARAILDARR